MSKTTTNQMPSDKKSQNVDEIKQDALLNMQVSTEQIINWIESRRSIGNLTIPAPSHKQIQKAVACAMTAPDHKKLQPWRFIVVEGNERHNFGKVLLQATLDKAQSTGETIDEKVRKKAYNMPLRAPVIITVVTQFDEHPKVPEFEQMLSAGAAVQNLLLALKAQGFSTVWRTGLLCNEPAVKQYFDVGKKDYVVAFVYTGTSTCAMPKRGDIKTQPCLTFKNSDS